MSSTSIGEGVMEGGEVKSRGRGGAGASSLSASESATSSCLIGLDSLTLSGALQEVALLGAIIAGVIALGLKGWRPTSSKALSQWVEVVIPGVNKMGIAQEEIRSTVT